MRQRLRQQPLANVDLITNLLLPPPFSSSSSVLQLHINRGIVTHELRRIALGLIGDVVTGVILIAPSSDASIKDGNTREAPFPSAFARRAHREWKGRRSARYVQARTSL
jgi:hypothetical protein